MTFDNHTLIQKVFYLKNENLHKIIKSKMNQIYILNKKIELLKLNIQECIDIDEESKNLKKEIYMKELNEALVVLKQLKNDNEVKKVMMTNDSLMYHNVKRKPNSVELMAELKENRQKAQKDFEKLKQIENLYVATENKFCPELPGYLFFSKPIVDAYGICPFIKLKDEDTLLIDRKKWLDEQSDDGILYYNLYEKIVKNCEVNSFIERKNWLEDYFDNMHMDMLSTSQTDLLTNTIVLIEEYIGYSIKTKKVKEKFNIIVNNASTLVVETSLKINEYLSEKYNIFIPVNTPKNLISKVELMSTVYDEKLVEYKGLKEKIEVSTKFVVNTTNNLKQLLYEYLYKDSQTTKAVKQNGKYFKKWSALTDEEKIDRYNSFAEFFVKKFLEEPKLITPDVVEDVVCDLQELLNKEMKTIKYVNIKWNVKRGVIEDMNILKYNNEDKEFYLKINKPKENTQKKTKKASSIKTSINKDTEKIINEELVMYMIQAKNDGKLVSNNIKTLKDESIDKLKLKLKLKRISVSDKTDILKRFEEIYTIISNNDYE